MGRPARTGPFVDGGFLIGLFLVARFAVRSKVLEESGRCNKDLGLLYSICYGLLLGARQVDTRYGTTARGRGIIARRLRFAILVWN